MRLDETSSESPTRSLEDVSFVLGDLIHSDRRRVKGLISAAPGRPRDRRQLSYERARLSLLMEYDPGIN